eukprot:1148007-Pelagomonas_calceolata.AAC.4
MAREALPALLPPGEKDTELEPSDPPSSCMKSSLSIWGWGDGCLLPAVAGLLEGWHAASGPRCRGDLGHAQAGIDLAALEQHTLTSTMFDNTHTGWSSLRFSWMGS